MKFGFVFTNYNNSLLTENAIKSVKNNCENEVKFVIVDNASDQKNREILQQIVSKHDNVHIIYNDQNVGYFPGLNLGIDYLRNHYSDYQFLVIGNNDLVFPPNFLFTISQKKSLFLKYPVVSPNIINLDGFHQNPHVIKEISKFRELLYDLYHLSHFLSSVITKLAHLTRFITDREDEKYHTTPQEIYQGYGACYILGPLFFKHFARLWAPTFLMYEEFFLSKQLADKQFKIYYEPSISLKHLARATTGKLSSKQKWLFSRQSYREYRKYVNPFSK